MERLNIKKYAYEFDLGKIEDEILDCIYDIHKSIDILKGEAEKYDSVSTIRRHLRIGTLSKEQYEYLLEDIRLLQSVLNKIVGPNIYVTFSISLANYLYRQCRHEILKYIDCCAYKCYFFNDTKTLQSDVDYFNNKKKTLYPHDFMMWKTMNGSGLLQVNDPRN